jgi:hypothetical protein
MHAMRAGAVQMYRFNVHGLLLDATESAYQNSLLDPVTKGVCSILRR